VLRERALNTWIASFGLFPSGDMGEVRRPEKGSQSIDEQARAQEFRCLVEQEAELKSSDSARKKPKYGQTSGKDRMEQIDTLLLRYFDLFYQLMLAKR
jgi:hypothetical protein